MMKHIKDIATHAPEAHNLTREDMLHLHNVTHYRSLRHSTPGEVSDKLTAQGFIENKLGGPVVTHQGVALILAQNGRYEDK